MMKIIFKNKRSTTKIWKDNMTKFFSHKTFFNTARVGESIEDNKELAIWVADQRVLFLTGELTKAEHTKLTEKGFVFNPANKTESEYIYEFNSIIKKTSLENIKNNENFSDFSSWFKKKTKNFKENVDNFEINKENDFFLKIMVSAKMLSKKEIQEKRKELKWHQKCEFIKSELKIPTRKFVFSTDPIEYRWINYYIKNKEFLNKAQKESFKEIEQSFRGKIEEEADLIKRKNEAKRMALEKDSSATRYTFEPCSNCNKNIYSMKGECTNCLGKRDKLSKEKRKRKNVTKFNAKVAACTAKRKARKIMATPKWVTEKEEKMINDIYLESTIKTNKEGISYNVDHIIPLVGKDYVEMEDGTLSYIQVVCGLHVPSNLHIITEKENKIKQARFDMKLFNEKNNKQPEILSAMNCRGLPKSS